MSVIATLAEPYGVTRIFFDCRDAPPDPADQQRIAQAIKQSVVIADLTSERWRYCLSPAPLEKAATGGRPVEGCTRIAWLKNGIEQGRAGGAEAS